MSDVTPLPGPREPLEPDDAVALEESMSRHPAGRRQRRPMPSVRTLVLDAAGDPIEVVTR